MKGKKGTIRYKKEEAKQRVEKSRITKRLKKTWESEYEKRKYKKKETE